MNDDAVRAALDAVIQERGEDYASLSRLLGRNPSYVQQFVKRGIPRRLSEEDRRKLADHLGVPERILGGPIDRPGRAVYSSALPRDGEDYVLIPAYDIRASAGPGALPAAETAESSLAFQARWARSIASGGIDKLAVIQVDGDSMQPSLSHGDHILIDVGDRERLRDGIYVLRSDDVLLVKRLSINPLNRRVNVLSDNPNYPTWTDCSAHDIDVIGRVIWVGRKL
jgi:Peptidase S24-like